jgi:hypothetical protein
MPQPISRVNARANIVLNAIGYHIFKDHKPALAPMAMEVIASWSTVETTMQNFYVELAGGPDSDLTALYMALDTKGPKSDVAKTLAERKLTPELLLIYRALLKLTKTREKDRNKLAHWTWGFCREMPNVLLLTDPKILRPTRDDIFVYTEEDFNRSVESFVELARHWNWFTRLISLQTPLEGYAWLFAELGIQGMQDRPA